MTDTSPRSNFSLWMQAARPFSFTASITPVLVGTALAYFHIGRIHFGWAGLAALGGLLLHAGTNLVSEYFDLKKGADRPETMGSSRVLVENLMTPARVLRGGLVVFALAFIPGILMVMHFGEVIVWLGLIGLVGGFFYTAAPLGYKYRALGEPLVFTLMGPLMVLGGYYVQTGELSWTPIWVSLPIGLLVSAILHANNLRDIPDDLKAGFKTIPILTGWGFSRWSYRLHLIVAYASVVVMAYFELVPWWALLAFVSLIPALKLNGLVTQAREMAPKSIAMLDVMTAQVHMMFGLLLTVGLVIGRLV